MIDGCDLSVARRHVQDALDLAPVVEFKLRPKDVVRRNDSFEGRANDLHRSCRNYVEVEMKSLNLIGQELVERSNVRF